MASYQYITTSISYLNGSAHLGHAYELIAADAMARFWRLCGKNVKFLTGTDEHGSKVQKAAQDRGMPPINHVDELSQEFVRLGQILNSTADDFIRTTQPRHIQAAQALWQELEDRGQIYLGNYAGWYSIRDEAFYHESDLVDGLAPTGTAVEWVEEPCYFFRLSHGQQPLLDYYQAHPDAILPKERFNETLSFIKQGLADLAISRTKITWGVPVPGHPEHVMYVWIDALTNYITALGYPDRQNQDFMNYWPESLHLIGKDILRFHTVFWPTFLMAAGIQPPKRVFAHGWWTIQGQKMSKSLGNGVSPFELVEKYGSDAVRYFLMREVRLGSDGDFSHEALTRRHNQELANTFGNLAQRVLAFIDQFLKGQLDVQDNVEGPDETVLRTWGQVTLPLLTELMERQDTYGYIDLIFSQLQSANAYMARLAPWELRKQGPEAKDRMITGLRSLVIFLKDAAILLSPFIPKAAARLLQILGAGTAGLQDLGIFLYNPSEAPSPLFQKIEERAL